MTNGCPTMGCLSDGYPIPGFVHEGSLARAATIPRPARSAWHVHLRRETSHKLYLPSNYLCVPSLPYSRLAARTTYTLGLVVGGRFTCNPSLPPRLLPLGRLPGFCGAVQLTIISLLGWRQPSGMSSWKDRCTPTLRVELFR
jgi:hypothetical protein